MKILTNDDTESLRDILEAEDINPGPRVEAGITDEVLLALRPLTPLQMPDPSSSADVQASEPSLQAASKQTSSSAAAQARKQAPSRLQLSRRGLDISVPETGLLAAAKQSKLQYETVTRLSSTSRGKKPNSGSSSGSHQMIAGSAHAVSPSDEEPYTSEATEMQQENGRAGEKFVSGSHIYGHRRSLANNFPRSTSFCGPTLGRLKTAGPAIFALMAGWSLLLALKTCTPTSRSAILR